MDYTDYSVEDFVKDEYFQKWIIRPNKFVVGFWREWVAEHPNKQQTIDRARNLIELVTDDSDQLLQTLNVDDIWKKILQKRINLDGGLPKSKPKKRQSTKRKSSKSYGAKRTKTKSKDKKYLNKE